MAKLTKSQIKALASLRTPKYRNKESKTITDQFTYPKRKNMENNHEIYRTCQNCGEETDVRKSPYCDNCGEIVKLFNGCVLFTLFSSAAVAISFLIAESG